MWVLRRYDLVKEQFDLAVRLTEDEICNWDTYTEFKYYFFSILMDCLYPFFMDEYDFKYYDVK
jgi:hypothetical protein